MKQQTGVDFRRLATVLARGGSSPATYGYDDATAPTTAYYRLRKRDLDGSTHFNPVVYVSATTSSYVLLPNPSPGEPFQLHGGPALADDAPLHLTLHNVMGRTLLAPAPAPARRWPGSSATLCARPRRACT